MDREQITDRMEVTRVTITDSAANTPINMIVYHRLMSNRDKQIVEIVNYVVLCSLVSGCGIVANVINIIVFIKQGLNSTINISFFALAISDLSSLILQQWFSICVNPLFQQADILIVPSEIQYMTGGIPRVCCARITFMITVYVTVERCLCVAFPLHIKQIITPRRTAVIIIGLYLVTISFTVPLYYVNNIGWKFYPERNKTLLGHTPASNRNSVERVVYMTTSIIGIFSFVAVVLFTGILISKLQQKSSWRSMATVNTKQSESISSRDRKVMNLVVLISGILIICNTPGVLMFMATFFEPDLSAGGRYSNLFFASWSFGFLFEAINSSVNIFLYFRMSSKYRDTFFMLFHSCRHFVTKHQT